MTTTHAAPGAAGLPLAPDAPWLAPLAGHSDLPFRLLCRENGAAVACTEMVSAKGLVYRSPGTEPLLATCPADTPLVVQLFGSDPAFVERAMAMLLERGPGWFDLNAGCSVRKVVRTGAGAALLRDPILLARVASTMVGLAGPDACGVKLRLGWRDEDNAAYLDAARRLEDAGVAWLSLHPRTAGQGFSGRSDRRALARLKDAVTIPVLASGDLFRAQDAVDCLDETGVDGVMFARGAMHDPAVFQRFLALRGDPRHGRNDPGPDPAATARLIRRHAELAREHASEHHGDRRALLRMRSAVPRYVRGLPGAGAMRMRLSACASWRELDDIVEELVAGSAEGTAASGEER